MNNKAYIGTAALTLSEVLIPLQHEIERLRLSCDNCHFEWNTKLRFVPLGGKGSKETYSNSRCPACKSGISVTMRENGNLEIHGARKI